MRESTRKKESFLETHIGFAFMVGMTMYLLTLFLLNQQYGDEEITKRKEHLQAVSAEVQSAYRRKTP